MTVKELATISPQSSKTVYIKRVKQIHHIMTNTFTNLSDIVDSLKSEGIEPKVIKLPTKSPRKSVWGVKQTKSIRQKVSA